MAGLKELVAGGADINLRNTMVGRCSLTGAYDPVLTPLGFNTWT